MRNAANCFIVFILKLMEIYVNGEIEHYKVSIYDYCNMPRWSIHCIEWKKKDVNYNPLYESYLIYLTISHSLLLAFPIFQCQSIHGQNIQH